VNQGSINGMNPENGSHKFDLSLIPQIDRTILTDVPSYVRICDVFYHLAENDLIHPGDILPGENILADHWDVSRATVRQAFRHLEEDGFVYKRQGKGTVIAYNASDLHRSLQWCYNICLENCTEKIKSIEMVLTFESCGEFLADKLESQAGNELTVVDFAYKGSDGTLSTSVLMCMTDKAKDLGVNLENLAEVRAFGLEGIYAKASGAQSVITAFGTDTDRKMKMMLKRGEVILYIEEILRDDLNKPIGHIKNYLRSEVYRIPVNRRSGF
jgi:DNA-binding GntR family transcriptional regulator